MESSKGLSPAVATSLLIIVVLAAVSSVYLALNTSIQQEADIEYPTRVSSLQYETCWKDDMGFTNFRFRHTGEKTINVTNMDVMMNGRKLPEKDLTTKKRFLEPGETISFEVEVPAGSIDSFTIRGNGVEVEKQCPSYVNFDNKNIDDFEKNLSPYTSIGTSDNYERVPRNAFEGTSSLRTSGSETVYINSSSGLETYPGNESKFTAKVKFERGEGDAQFMFGRNGPGNFYGVELDRENSSLKLINNSFSSSPLDQSNADIDSREWYRIEVIWDHVMVVRLYDSQGKRIGEVAGDTEDYIGNGIAFRTFPTGSTTVHYDDLDLMENYKIPYLPLSDFEDGNLDTDQPAWAEWGVPPSTSCNIGSTDPLAGTYSMTLEHSGSGANSCDTETDNQEYYGKFKFKIRMNETGTSSSDATKMITYDNEPPSPLPGDHRITAIYFEHDSQDIKILDGSNKIDTGMDWQPGKVYQINKDMERETAEYDLFINEDFKGTYDLRNNNSITEIYFRTETSGGYQRVTVDDFSINKRAD